MKNKFLYLLLIISFILSPLSTAADGGAIRPLPNGDWTWADEYSQQAFINYENGVEKLIIAVNLEEGNSDIAWIVPVPSSPEKVEIDITSELPMFFGDEVISKAKLSFSKNLETSYYAGLLGQIWTFPFALVFVSLGGARDGGGQDYSLGDPAVISAHIEKAGMISEVITAKDSQAIYNYFSQKGFEIEQGSITELDSYIEKDYSFVVSWITPELANKRNKGERGIFISFPVPKIYYPLILTSAYGEAEIPVTIRVAGHVEPEIYPEIEPYTKVNYFTERTIGRGHVEARCISDMLQIRTPLEIHYANYGSYPSSLEELLENDPDVKVLVEDISRTCNTYPLYLSKDSNDYTMRLGLSKKVYEINSSLSGGYMDKTDEEKTISPELQKFYGNSKAWIGKAKYTKINIDAPAKLFKEDLWMKEGKPLNISFALWVINNPWIAALALYLLIIGIYSLLAGGIAGLICFHKFKRYALVGLGNLAGLLGLFFTFNHIKKKHPEEIKYSEAGFCFLFSIIFVLLLGFGTIAMTSLDIGWAAALSTVFILIVWTILLFVRFLSRKIVSLINSFKK